MYCHTATSIRLAPSNPLGSIMEDPNEILRSEHEALQALLSVLDDMAKRLAANQLVPREDLNDAMMVVVEYADRCHCTKEELVLFPILATASPKAGAEITRRMAEEHRGLRRLVRGIQEILPRGSMTTSARVELGRILASYVQLLRDHIRIEEELLFPEVDRSIPRPDRARILREFERVEREEVGWGMHAAYHSIIHRLGEAYGT